MKTALRIRWASTFAAAVGLVVVAAASGCTMNKGVAVSTTPVATSASVKVPAGPAQRTAPGADLRWGQSAILPAYTFTPGKGLAMFTVTGINPAGGLPDSTTKGGKGYYVYLTVTSLSDKPAAAPDITGLAGSVDGKKAALTVAPPENSKDCTATTPPETMKSGDSYATCQIALVDADQTVKSVIYWANTTSDAALNYQNAPVVWSDGTPASSSPRPVG